MYGDLLNTIGFVETADPEVGEAMELELKRQRRNLELIASENIVSPAVMAAMGTVLTNKYAEGYPGHRYYGGCACVSRVEKTANDRAKLLIGAEHVNVQPHSGAQANTAVYVGLLEHGDTVMFSAGEPFYATPGKGRNEIRIAYVLKQEDLERAMDLLALGIRKYNETH